MSLNELPGGHSPFVLRPAELGVALAQDSDSEGAAQPDLEGPPVGVVDEVVEHAGTGPGEPCPGAVDDRSQPPWWSGAPASALEPPLQQCGAVGEGGERLRDATHASDQIVAVPPWTEIG